jgi:AcrR family transcriptional regulator
MAGPLPEHLSSVRAGVVRLPSREIARHRRDRVLSAAVDVFVERGYRGTTVDRILAAAKVGVGSFYELFDNKEDCFLQTYDRAVVTGRERIESALPVGRPWLERASAGLRALFAAIAAEPDAARLVLIEAQTAGSAATTRHQAMLDGFIPLLREGRGLSTAGDTLSPSVEPAIVGGLAFLLEQRLAMGGIESIEDLLPDALEFMLAPYQGEEEAVWAAQSLTQATVSPTRPSPPPSSQPSPLPALG